MILPALPLGTGWSFKSCPSTQAWKRIGEKYYLFRGKCALLHFEFWVEACLKSPGDGLCWCNLFEGTFRNLSKQDRFTD